jgi:hypothetical protein
MFNITNHQVNENHDHNEVSPHHIKNDYYKKRLKKTSAGENVEKRESLHTIHGNVN